MVARPEACLSTLFKWGCWGIWPHNEDPAGLSHIRMPGLNLRCDSQFQLPGMMVRVVEIWIEFLFLAFGEWTSEWEREGCAGVCAHMLLFVSDLCLSGEKFIFLIFDKSFVICE